MLSDTLTYNNNLFPDESSSFFKKLIQKQDEAPEIILKNSQYPYSTSQLKNENLLKQISFTEDHSYIPSFFREKSISINEIPIQKQTTQQNDIIFNILMFLLLLQSIWIFLRKKRFVQLFRAVWAPRYINQLLREGNIQNELITYIFMFFNAITMSLIIARGLEIYFLISVQISHIAYIFLVLFILFLIKLIVIKILQIVFKTKEQTSEYLVNNYLFTITSTVIILPSTFMVYFMNHSLGEIAFYMTVFFILLMLILRAIRSYILGISYKSYPSYYFILYFCTVEILPIILVVKLLMNYYFKQQLIL